MQAFPTGPVIVASRPDPASMNIAQELINHHGFRQETPQTPNTYSNGDLRLVFVEKEGIYVQPQDLPVAPSTIIFASKHRSSTNTPALTVHATGNLTPEALYGGNPEEVSLVEPHRIRKAISTLLRETGEAHLNIEVTMEATHHGPTNFPVPICFVEVGSGPTQWTDPVLGRIAAAAANAAATCRGEQTPNAVGFGGTHYSQKVTRICAEGDYQIGHVVPRHAFDAQVSERIINDTFKKTMGLCKTALVDWKGLKGDQRKNLLDLLAARDIEAVRC